MSELTDAVLMMALPGFMSGTAAQVDHRMDVGPEGLLPFLGFMESAIASFLFKVVDQLWFVSPCCQPVYILTGNKHSSSGVR
jgi:hypothetical protein